MAETLPLVYGPLEFPLSPPDRPYVLTNMVMTLDGKTVSGTREEAVMDLGSELDHATMRQIQGAVDAVMIGARTLRGTRGLWFPPHLTRVVCTRSGQITFASRFFADKPEKAIVATPSGTPIIAPPDVRVFASGVGGVDLHALMGYLRREAGIDRLLCEGGSELNGALFGAGLVDEMFITLAPKVKLGSDTPTYASGTALEKGHLQEFTLIEDHRRGDEVYLRYRRMREGG